MELKFCSWNHWFIHSVKNYEYYRTLLYYLQFQGSCTSVVKKCPIEKNLILCLKSICTDFLILFLFCFLLLYVCSTYSFLVWSWDILIPLSFSFSPLFLSSLHLLISFFFQNAHVLICSLYFEYWCYMDEFKVMLVWLRLC